MSRKTRRDFLKTLGIGAASAGLPGRAWAKPRGKPNILFIFGDDQCYEAVRALGNNEIITPNLDRLVNGGVTFTHAYNQGAWHGAVCVASRTMLNTGVFLWHAGALERAQRGSGKRRGGKNGLRGLAEKKELWGQLLAGTGYDTYMAGKWHVKVSPQDAFAHTRNVRGGMPNQTREGYNRPREGKPDPWKPWDPKFGGYWKGGKHWSEVLGDDAAGFIGQAARRQAPFFMYLAFNAPHDPRQSPKSYVDKYPLDRIKVPENYRDEYEYKDAIGCGKGLRDEKLAPFPRTHYAVKVNRQEYYAIVTHMDAQIGRILDALDKSGKAANTYIFFTADHGLAVGHHGLMGKQNMFDHSLRAPLMVTGPGVPKGRRIETPVYLQDIMPTTLEVAGARKPERVQFRSLLPVIRGERDSNYDALYGGYTKLQRMVVEGGYKMILYPKIRKVLLFNLKTDPYEMSDLAADPRNLRLMRKLFATFRRLQKETGDKLDLASTYPRLAR
ncbi:MAG: sulfatase-like hydrolase/transferase [Planctomycetota bacterium]|jgi:choline-sulfatase